MGGRCLEKEGDAVIYLTADSGVWRYVFVGFHIPKLLGSCEEILICLNGCIYVF